MGIVMSLHQKNGPNVSPEEKEQAYQSIMKLYDVAENYIDVLEAANTPGVESYIPLVEAFVHQLEETAEVLAEAYIMFAETDRKPPVAQRRKVEGAMRKMQLAFETFKRERQKLLH
ncbi:MAG: hypothetical protein H6908_04985 [Hyphomicrobiales bacterium]|nr:hypothetical protein [Hyphomicrobiales bacterium]